jgi:uncharacterized ferritin-like protein (DUF455 family)
MQIREFADRILLSESLPEKLKPPESPLADDAPGEAVRIEVPARRANLLIAGRGETPPMPKPGGFRDPARRAIAHHIMANHELQALEVMAFVLRAFPEAPAAFRLGMVDVMRDEQRHTRMHVERAGALGLEFGSLPINGYIWKKAQEFRNVLDYICGLPLVFEGRNLDHTIDFEEHFLAVDDEKSAALMRAIHRDEIEHVRFGMEWLRKLKPPDQSEWDTFAAHLHWPLQPSKSRGDRFYPEPRAAAGMSEEFIARLETVKSDAEG